MIRNAISKKTVKKKKSKSLKSTPKKKKIQTKKKMTSRGGYAQRAPPSLRLPEPTNQVSANNHPLILQLRQTVNDRNLEGYNEVMNNI